ncbi:unnamed protein product [Arabis nemorensis]|uniref:Uncharacterized protein n=1 Tax=Arabis nemorensis TaxID=586526 RepID=A0A565BAT9_9BRAS|nr:unnamed protein product [Arabis nemorensis]
MNRPRKKKELSLLEELKELDLLEEEEIVEIPDLENDDLIEENSQSIIVRCLNPTVHKVGGLIKALPPIWGMEDRVVGEESASIEPNSSFRTREICPMLCTEAPGSSTAAVEALVKPLGRVEIVELHAKQSSSLEYVTARVWVKADEPLQFRKMAHFRTGERAPVELDAQAAGGEKEVSYAKI